MAEDKPQSGPVGPTWGPSGLTHLARSLSSNNLQTLHKVSSTLTQNIQKNGELLMLTASQVTQPQVHRLKSSLAESARQLGDDWALIKRVGTVERKRPAPMRRSASANDFRSMGPQLRLPRVVAPSPLKQSSSSNEGEWDLMAALNNTLNQARAANRPVFGLPSRSSFEQQVRGLASSRC